MGLLDYYKLPKNEWKKTQNCCSEPQLIRYLAWLLLIGFHFEKHLLLGVFLLNFKARFSEVQWRKCFLLQNLMRHILKTKQHKFGTLQRFETRIMKKTLKFFIFLHFFFGLIKSTIHNVDEKYYLPQKITLIYRQHHPKNNFYDGLRYHRYIYQRKKVRKTPTGRCFSIWIIIKSKF